MFTFGAGMYGQLGHNGTSNEFLPRKVQDLMGSEITQIACGRCHMLAYSASGARLYAFGLAGNGQLGLGDAQNKSSPSPIKISFINPKNVRIKFLPDKFEFKKFCDCRPVMSRTPIIYMQ